MSVQGKFIYPENAAKQHYTITKILFFPLFGDWIVNLKYIFSVVVLCGSLLEASDRLLKKGLHPTSISEAFQKAAAKSVEILTNMAIPVDLSDRDKLLQSANTSLNSKVVSQHSTELSPIAVDAVLKVIDPAKTDTVNLNDIKVIKKLGGTVDDTELIEGLVFQERAAGNVKKVEKAKVIVYIRTYVLFRNSSFFRGMF